MKSKNDTYTVTIIDGPTWIHPYYSGELTDEKALEFLKERIFTNIMTQVFDSKSKTEKIKLKFKGPHLGKYKKSQTIKILNPKKETEEDILCIIVDRHSVVELIEEVKNA